MTHPKMVRADWAERAIKGLEKECEERAAACGLLMRENRQLREALLHICNEEALGVSAETLAAIAGDALRKISK